MANRLIDQAWPKVPSKNVAIAAQLLWSSDLELDSYELRRQFYWMINDAIRSDKSPLIDSAAPLIRAINLLCICRGAVASRFPPSGLVYRGTSIPDKELLTYRLMETRKLRVSGFLATSFNQQVVWLSWFCHGFVCSS
jgi:hypothetical protein